MKEIFYETYGIGENIDEVLFKAFKVFNQEKKKLRDKNENLSTIATTTADLNKGTYQPSTLQSATIELGLNPGGFQDSHLVKIRLSFSSPGFSGHRDFSLHSVHGISIRASEETVEMTLYFTEFDNLSKEMARVQRQRVIITSFY